MKEFGNCTLAALDRYQHPLTYGRAVCVVESIIFDGDLDGAAEVIRYLVEVGTRVRSAREEFYIALGIRQAVESMLGHRDSERVRREAARDKARSDAHARRLGLLPPKRCGRSKPAALPVSRRPA